MIGGRSTLLEKERMDTFGFMRDRQLAAATFFPLSFAAVMNHFSVRETDGDVILVSFSLEHSLSFPDVPNSYFRYACSLMLRSRNSSPISSSSPPKSRRERPTSVTLLAHTSTPLTLSAILTPFLALMSTRAALFTTALCCRRPPK